MRFRTVVIAAAILTLASVAGLAAFQLAEDARGESAQDTIQAEDSLAVEPDIRQHLAPQDDHDPTQYGENGTETVEYNGTVWQPSPENYTYYPDEGELEFHRDEPGEANISFQYEIPENQVADDQLQTLTIGHSHVAILAIGLVFVVLFLFVGAFVTRKMGVGNRKLKGR